LRYDVPGLDGLSSKGETALDQFSEIGVFVKVVELCSLTKTADALETSNATVSRILSKLEADLGAKLLERTTRRVSPTPDGLAFYERCERILDDLEEAKNEVTALRETPRGTVRVVLPVSYGKIWLMPMLNSIAKRFPELTISVTLSDRLDDLTEDSFDVAVSIGNATDSRLVARKLRQSRIVTAAAPGYLEEWGTPQSPQDLLKHNCLLYVRPGRRLKWLWEFIDAKQTHHNVAIHGNMLIDNGEALLEAAAQGVGVIQAPDYVTQPQLRKGALVEILADYQPPGPTIWVLYPPSRQRASRAQMLIDELFAMADSLPGMAPA
jgi:DNA-binding transcriptional LysR family regulator